jgi:hypothetical protein
MLVIGGGYIGLELGSVYAALGTKVSVVEMTAGLLPGADRDLVRILNQRARRRSRRSDALDQGAGMKDGEGGHHVSLRGRGAPQRPPSTTCWSRSGAGPTRRSRARADEGPGDGQGLHRDRRPAAHRRADHLRHRRRGGRADARAQGVARGARRRRSDRRPQGGVRAAGDSGRGVHRPGDRVGGLTETEAEKRRGKVEVARFRGAPRAARSRSIAWTG